MVEILTTDPLNPDARVIHRAVEILRAGGVIAYPTETLYGLAADARNKEAIERIFAIKGRDFDKPIPLIIGNREALSTLVSEVSERSAGLINLFWPGPLTLIFHASERISDRLTAGTGKIGIRLSSHQIAWSLATVLHGAITATSANISGESGISSPEGVSHTMGNHIDALIDGGVTAGGPGSTVLDVTCDPPVVLRDGAIPSSV
ncbi:MAG: threonylcarbamoyl-AMP synthase, partial [Deltaproteobacteria bacterium]|nr:threonylcarbamoyl-AMP synthase [Deltaproteobacteria bacterium]